MYLSELFGACSCARKQYVRNVCMCKCGSFLTTCLSELRLGSYQYISPKTLYFLHTLPARSLF